MSFRLSFKIQLSTCMKSFFDTSCPIWLHRSHTTNDFILVCLIHHIRFYLLIVFRYTRLNIDPAMMIVIRKAQWLSFVKRYAIECLHKNHLDNIRIQVFRARSIFFSLLYFISIWFLSLIHFVFDSNQSTTSLSNSPRCRHRRHHIHSFRCS